MIRKEDMTVVLAGGPSHEADISRNTGKAVANGLLSLGYRIELLEYRPQYVLEELRKVNAKAVFIAVHGKYGEDGKLQGALELAGVPYTGSGVASCAITMDKIISSRFFKANGIRMASSRGYSLDEGVDEVRRSLLEIFDFPLVLKPACEGSTIGIEFVNSPDNLSTALSRVFSIEPRILAEAYIEGKEFTVPVLDGEALPVIQICPHSGSYDFHSKYTQGATDYLTPAPISAALEKEMKEMAVTGYRLAECGGVARFDFRTDEYDLPFLLEANSVPGMTETSLVPKSAREAGISFPSLCERILLGAGLGKV